MNVDALIDYGGHILLLSGLYYLLYSLFFHKTAHPGFNRYLLLGLVLLSLLLPLLPQQIWLPEVAPTTINLPIEWINAGNEQINTIIETIPPSTDRLHLFLVIAYALGCTFFFLRLLLELGQVIFLIKRSPIQKVDQFYLIRTQTATSAFSFFNYIFYPAALSIEAGDATLLHEQAHARQLHSIDRLLIEVIRSIFWFNPFFYGFKRRMIENHEFLADQAVIQTGFPTTDYMYLLLRSAQIKTSPVKSTFHSFLKKRIMKLSAKQAQTSPFLLLVLLVIPPLFLALELPENSFQDCNEAIEIPSPEIIQQDTLTMYPPLPAAYFERLSSGFGIRMHPITRKKMMHNGVDFIAPKGTLVSAIADGSIIKSEYNKQLGNYVVIKHRTGIKSRYHHLSENLVKEGQHIKGNTPIGKVGSTGISTAPHLHFSIQMPNNEYVDPEKYLVQIKPKQ